MTENFYTFVLTDRRRMMADTGFVRDELRVWSHPDGRAIGESVAAALTDEAFLRFLKPETVYNFAGEFVCEGAETVVNHSAQ
jgi:hypothetical protein